MDPSRRKKMFDSNGLMDHPTGLYRRKNTDSNGLTDSIHTGNSYPSYLLTILEKNKLISTLEKEKERLIVMARNILEILSLIVHFINDTI